MLISKFKIMYASHIIIYFFSFLAACQILIPFSPGGQNLLNFLEVRQVLSTYDGDLRDPLW